MPSWERNGEQRRTKKVCYTLNASIGATEVGKKACVGVKKSLISKEIKSVARAIIELCLSEGIC